MPILQLSFHDLWSFEGLHKRSISSEPQLAVVDIAVLSLMSGVQISSKFDCWLSLLSAPELQVNAVQRSESTKTYALLYCWLPGIVTNTIFFC